MNKSLVMMIVSFMALCLVISGCKPEASAPAPPLEIPEPVDEEFVEPEDLQVDVADVAPEPEPEQEPEPEPEPEPSCGDGKCQPGIGENCDRCYADCACKSPAECHNGECKVPECGSDGECQDDDACTIDTCFFAQHPNAYCGHELIKKCKNNDGCCPPRCDANLDSDCEPVCDNGVCEPGENSSNCDEDCPEQQATTGPVCGDANCDSGEDFRSCPEDCT
ncbi:hypothetical protein KY359_04305 [Candidatus Woesearchaeota archaeon]|nr:hypothetical protein [Candidatus Woesearchaeota archaeon]